MTLPVVQLSVCRVRNMIYKVTLITGTEFLQAKNRINIDD